MKDMRARYLGPVFSFTSIALLFELNSFEYLFFFLDECVCGGFLCHWAWRID